MPIMEIATYILIVAVLLTYGALEARLKRMERRAARLERKADLILGHLGVRQEEPGLERVTALLRENKKIQAIKAYREITDADLKEAKEAVERMDGTRG
jgi:ribosomal protein L7/L12